MIDDLGWVRVKNSSGGEKGEGGVWFSVGGDIRCWVYCVGSWTSKEKGSLGVNQIVDAIRDKSARESGL